MPAKQEPSQPQALMAPTDVQDGQEWKALETVGDGSCGFNAIALGIGFYFAQLKPAADDADFDNKNQDFKKIIGSWVKAVAQQWHTRNNPTLKEFTPADQVQICNLIKKFPGKTPDDLVNYQKAMASILRKYTAHGLNEEVEDIFSFFNNQNTTLYFPIYNPETKVIDLKMFIEGQGLICVATQTNQAQHQTANDQAGLLGALDEDFRDNESYPAEPTFDENTKLADAKLAHQQYIAEYKQGLTNECLTNLENAPTWLSARGMVACRNIIHTSKFPFEIHPLSSIQEIQALQRYELRLVNEFPEPQNHSEDVIYIKKDKTYSVISKGSIVDEKFLEREIGEINTERLLNDTDFKKDILSFLGLPHNYDISLMSDLPAEKVVHVEQMGQQLRCLYKKDNETKDVFINYIINEKLTSTAKQEILTRLSLSDYGVNDTPNKSNVVYLEKTNNKLRCIFKTPGQAIATGKLNIEGDLTSETLQTQRAAILAKTCTHGHTISSGEENAGPFNLQIINLHGYHWELLKEEQACAAIQYPGGYDTSTAPSNFGYDAYHYNNVPENNDISEAQTIGWILVAFVFIGIQLAWSPIILGLMGIVGIALACEQQTSWLYNTYCPNIMKSLSDIFNYCVGTLQPSPPREAKILDVEPSQDDTRKASSPPPDDSVLDPKHTIKRGM